MALNTRQQLEQGRAESAYARVKGFVDDPQNKSAQDEYKSYSKKFPMMVKTNGLGAALAFIKSKQKKAYDRIYDDLSVWLQKDHKRIVEFPEKGDLLEIVVKMDSSSGYRALSNEVLAYMNWHRRFTEALIKK